MAKNSSKQSNNQNTKQISETTIDQSITQSVQQPNDSFITHEGIQGTFYQNILAGGARPTVIAILIIMIGNVLETGTFFGFFVPVDVLLFTSGTILGANSRRWSALFMFLFCVISTVAGDMLGYRWAGALGEKLYDRPDTRYFKKKYLYRAQAYFEKYSDKALYIGRFIVIGSFLPMLAGVAKMNLVRFGIHSLLSSIIWTATTFIPSLMIGYFWPGVIESWWLVALGFIIFTLTEMIAWVVLFNSDIKQITSRIRASHEEFANIKHHFHEIKHQVGEIAHYVVQGDEPSIEDQGDASP